MIRRVSRTLICVKAVRATSLNEDVSDVSDANIHPLDRPGPESNTIRDAGVFSTMANRELGPAMIASRPRTESSLLSIMVGTPKTKKADAPHLRAHRPVACQQISAD